MVWSGAFFAAPSSSATRLRAIASASSWRLASSYSSTRLAIASLRSSTESGAEGSRRSVSIRRWPSRFSCAACASPLGNASAQLDTTAAKSVATAEMPVAFISARPRATHLRFASSFFSCCSAEASRTSRSGRAGSPAAVSSNALPYAAAAAVKSRRDRASYPLRISASAGDVLSLPRIASTPCCTKERNSFGVADPTHRPRTDPSSGSMTRKVGQASSGNLSRKSLFFGFSLSTERYTAASRTGRSPGSGKT